MNVRECFPGEVLVKVIEVDCLPSVRRRRVTYTKWVCNLDTLERAGVAIPPAALPCCTVVRLSASIASCIEEVKSKKSERDCSTKV